MKTTLLSTCAILLGSALPPTIAQAPPLPSSLEPHFKINGPVADTFDLPGGAEILTHVWFSTGSERGVHLRYFYQGTGTTPNYHDTFISTTFEPTATCKHRGLGNTLYVAGYSPRTGKVIVERWTLTEYAVLEVPFTDPDTSPATAPEAQMAGPRIRKELLFECGSVPPITDMAAIPSANQLWMLDEPSEGQVRHMRAFDLQTGTPDCAALTLPSAGTPSVFINSVEFPEVANINTMNAAVHPEYGFLIYMESRRQWQSIVGIYEPYTLTVIGDRNQDGVMEEFFSDSYTSFFTTYPPYEFSKHY